jgi:hypothetical protein
MCTSIEKIIEEAVRCGAVVVTRKVSRIGDKNKRYVLTLPTQQNMQWEVLWKLDTELIVIIIPKRLASPLLSQQ